MPEQETRALVAGHRSKLPTALPAENVPIISPQLLHNLAVCALGPEGQGAIGVASVLHGEGATTIAASLAACIAGGFGKRVIIVDANLRTPALHRVFGLNPGPGFADMLGGGVALEKALQVPTRGPVGAGGLLVLPARRQEGDVHSPWLGTQIGKLIDALYGYADVLVFDCAPLLAYPDTILLGRQLDGVAVVLRAERTTWDEGTRAVQELRNGGSQVMGAVLNRGVSPLPRLLDRLL